MFVQQLSIKFYNIKKIYKFLIGLKFDSTVMLMHVDVVTHNKLNLFLVKNLVWKFSFLVILYE